MPSTAADDAISRFADALIWNWLIGGTDAHAKNYSLLLLGTDVALAPLYDVASILPYGRNERELRFAMKLGGDYRVFPHRNTWPKLAAELKQKADALEERVLELARRAPDAFAEAARAADVQALASELPARLTDLVADRATRCASVVHVAREGATQSSIRGHEGLPLDSHRRSSAR